MTIQTQPETARLFIALPIPERVKAEAQRLQQELRAVAPGEGVRWVRPDQTHLTLKFLGNVAGERCDALVAAVREACRGMSSFTLRAGSLGFFPHERRPRVLWTGIHGQTERLQTLQRAIEAATADFVEKQEDREFSPHLTLARIKSLRPDEARALAKQVQREAARILGEWTADKVEVMRSELHSEGSRYTCLAEVPLLAS